MTSVPQPPTGTDMFVDFLSVVIALVVIGFVGYFFITALRLMKKRLND